MEQEQDPIEKLEYICNFIDCCYYFIKKIKIYIDSIFFTSQEKLKLIASINLLKDLCVRCCLIIDEGLSY